MTLLHRISSLLLPVSCYIWHKLVSCIYTYTEASFHLNVRGESLHPYMAGDRIEGGWGKVAHSCNEACGVVPRKLWKFMYKSVHFTAFHLQIRLVHLFHLGANALLWDTISSSSFAVCNIACFAVLPCYCYIGDVKLVLRHNILSCTLQCHLLHKLV